MTQKKQRENTSLRDAWHLFIKKFIIKIKHACSDCCAIRRVGNTIDDVRFVFDFNLVSIRAIYCIVAEILCEINTKGILKKLTKLIADVTNLCTTEKNVNNVNTRYNSLYKAIIRHMA